MGFVVSTTDRHGVRREYDGPLWGLSCITLNYVYVDTLEGKSLTSMTVYAGWTIMIMTVCRRCPSWDIWKKIGDP